MLKSDRLSDATVGNQVDNLIAQLEAALGEILGIPVDVEIGQAMFLGEAEGLKELLFTNKADEPEFIGRMVMNGDRLQFHNGTVQGLAYQSDIAEGTNAFGARTISLSPPSGTPQDGDVWDQI